MKYAKLFPNDVTIIPNENKIPPIIDTFLYPKIFNMGPMKIPIAIPMTELRLIISVVSVALRPIVLNLSLNISVNTLTVDIIII